MSAPSIATRSRGAAAAPVGRIGPPGPSRAPRAVVVAAAAILGGATLTGCALTPDGTKQQQSQLAEAGRPYEPAFEQRVFPELPPSPTWRDVLHRAFLANGDLEASYFEWKAAVERIEMASAYPNSNIQVGYSYMFSSEKMKTFDRQTFSFGFDPSMNLSLPAKVRQEGKVALDAARAAGERFRAAKFDLQRRVLSQWADLGMLEAKQRVQAEQVSLSRLAIEAIGAKAQAGGVQRDLLRLEALLRTQENELQNSRAELSASRALLNGMIARDPNAAIDTSHDAPREVAASDGQILAAAVDLNPEIAALARQAEGRSDALELARMQWLPDINPSFMFTGSVSQAVGVMVMLPTTVAEIRGGIREAEAMLRAGEAVLRQARSDRGAMLVATLVAMRNSDRQATLFESTLVPLADRVLANTRQAYAAGSAAYVDLLESQGLVLDTRLMAIEAHAAHDKRLAELESLMGTDIETIAGPAASPTTPIDPATTAQEEARHDR